jgi:hypothetical protein
MPQCSFTRELGQGTQPLPGPPPGRPAEGQGNQDRNWQPTPAADQHDKGYLDEANVEQYNVLITQEEDKRNDRWYEAEVNAVMLPEPQYMHWVQGINHPRCKDHPIVMRRPGGYALVLNPIVFSDTHTCHFSRVLIDGGSGINLMYHTSMEKLGIP